MPEFWKTCNSKFRKNVSKQVIINGHTDNLNIANEFASHFSQVHYQSTDDAVSNEAFQSLRSSSDSAVLNLLIAALTN